MKSAARTVEEYLATLPEDRREAISAVRNVIVENLPAGYQEVMNWGMIAYEVPLSVYPDTYNGKPLLYAALASQKNHMAVFLTAIYMSDETRESFERRYRAAGKKLNAGKSCVRFTRLEHLPLPLIGDVVALTGMEEFVERVQRATSARKAKRRT